eukprot:m.297315 g.297315  ORF g.297315 m.297315 type:complete len:430 (+) comp20078_c1_seq1:567-1856(+)
MADHGATSKIVTDGLVEQPHRGTLKRARIDTGSLELRRNEDQNMTFSLDSTPRRLSVATQEQLLVSTTHDEAQVVHNNTSCGTSSEDHTKSRGDCPGVGSSGQDPIDEDLREHPQQLSSGSAGRNDETLSRCLECPMCRQTMVPPIFQCKSGHVICRSCRKKWMERDSGGASKGCPTCRTPMDDIRNRVLEDLAYTLELPCCYAEHGCKKVLLAVDRIAHEEICDRNPVMPCPFSDNCLWEGSSAELFGHLNTESQESHASGKMVQDNAVASLIPREDRPVTCTLDEHGSMNTKIYRLPILASSPPQSVEDGFDENYVLFVRQSIPEIRSHACFAKFIGAEAERRMVQYKLRWEGDGRRVVWTDTPHSARRKNQDIVDARECLTLPYVLTSPPPRDVASDHGNAKSGRGDASAGALRLSLSVSFDGPCT